MRLYPRKGLVQILTIYLAPVFWGLYTSHRGMKLTKESLVITLIMVLLVRRSAI